MKIKQTILTGFLLITSATLLMTACSSSSSESRTPSSSTQNVASEDSTSIVASVSESEAVSESSALNGINFTASNVRNDATGNWRISCIAEHIDMIEYSLEYYNTYFTDDNEIHFIVNFNNNTTTKISSMGGQLDVTVRDYVSKEEHDANILNSGTLLAEYFVDKETGEIEQIQ